MSGTNGSFITQEVNQLDGYVLPITSLGNINITFVDNTCSISVHNVTNDFVEVTVKMSLPALGNGKFILAPNSAQSISSSPQSPILSIDVLDLGLLSAGGGFIVANSFYN